MSRRFRTGTWSFQTARLGSTEPNEDALRAHPPKTSGGLLNYGRKN